MHPSGWWIIAGAVLLIVASTISGIRNRHSFTDLWVVVIVVTWLALLLDEDLPPFGAVAFCLLVFGSALAGFVSWWRSRRAV